MSALPTPTIVRIKRKIGSETSESIIVSSKRKKISEDDYDDETNNQISGIYTTILKKITTLKSDDSVEIETKKILENGPKHSAFLKENYKKGFTATAKELVHKKAKPDIAAIRFKLVCSKRNLEKDSSSKEKDSQDDVRIYDAMKETDEAEHLPVASSSNVDSDVITCNGIPMESGKVEYVYDLYYTNLPLEMSTWIDNICEIRRYGELEYRHQDSKDDSSDLGNDDEDDENEESNWRNDYPDEDDDQLYEDEDDFLSKQFQKAKLDDSDESFDTNDYDESGDFDEDGNLLLYRQPARSVFKKYQKQLSTSSSDDD